MNATQARYGKSKQSGKRKHGKKKSGDEYAKKRSGASNIPKVVHTDEEFKVHTGKAARLVDGLYMCKAVGNS